LLARQGVVKENGHEVYYSLIEKLRLETAFKKKGR
jgi:hypothetical protein